jgi:hypothetical protein
MEVLEPKCDTLHLETSDRVNSVPDELRWKDIQAVVSAQMDGF